MSVFAPLFMEKWLNIIVLLFFGIALVSAQNTVSEKVLCESSDGNWIDNKCVCPENSIGFKDGFGCDYQTGFAQVSDSQDKSHNPFLIVLVIGIIFLIILIILIKILKSKNGKKNKAN